MKRILMLICLCGVTASLAGCGARRSNAAEYPTNNAPPQFPPVQNAPVETLKVPMQNK